MREFTRIVKDKFGTQELIGVEVGVNKGENAAEMLKELNLKKLILVDSWRTYEYPTNEEITYGYTNQLYLDQLYFNATTYFKKFENVYIYKLSSMIASCLIKDTFDFIYLDASHRFADLLEDCVRWSPKLNKDGIIGGHDWYHEYFQNDIHNAIHSFLKLTSNSFTIENLYIVGDDWYLKNVKN